MTGRAVDPVIRFWNKVQRSENEDGCWLWTGSINWLGYGRFYPKHGVNKAAHRYSYELAYGPIPEGMDVLHHCDQRNCIRPDHLFLGTHTDNMRDMASKNGGVYHPFGKGAANLNAKLNEAAVLDIRARWRFRKVTARQLAAEYGVSRSLVTMIVRGKLW